MNKILTQQQLKEISEIIDKHIGVMLYMSTGNGKPDPSLLKRLGIPENAPSMIQNAFVLGKIVKMMSDTDLSNLSYDQLKQKAREYALSPVERNSLNYSKENAGRYVTALGQKIQRDTQGRIIQISHDANLAVAQQKLISDTVSNAILNQDTRGKLASELGHAFNEWERDWQRVSHTEIWNAKLQGEVTAILQGDSIYSHTKGKDSQVFRRPSADACNHCKRLYLEADGVTPKVFHLSELIANGTNVGKKVREWEPITGTTHPNCTCPIAVLPEGFGFDNNGNLEFKG